nr:MAG TPA: PORTAL PROTEIN [Caudoviricetes sp.]
MRALTVEINPENYKSILKIFKDAIIENARGFNAKDERMSNNPNEMNIQSMYSDIDLDANGMETLFQSSLNKVLWFVNNHLNNIGIGNFEEEKVEIIFNKDILINEAQTIENCAKSMGIISEETIISQHPWVKDVKAELEKVKKEKEEKIDQYGNAFDGQGDPDGEEE